jgi:uncharacterized protein YndB with AHSA1/START domain
MSDTLTFTQTINVSPDLVYHAFTNAMTLRRWLCDNAQVQGRVESSLFLSWNRGYYAVGEFTALEPDKRVAFTWHGRKEPAPTHVEVAFAPEGDGTRVELKHSGVGLEPAWEETRTQFKIGWKTGLENLKYMLETGMDLRVVRRPLLGIMPMSLDAEAARRLGVPVQEGLRLDGVQDGLAAANAGLQAGDVMVSLDGKPVVDFLTLMAAVGSHRAGDTVDVTYYRGSAKRTVSLVFSPRPMPEVPAGPAELAETLRSTYAELDAELDALVAGAPEGYLSRRPAPDEWSANEVLAHLIHTERIHQVTIWLTVGGDDSLWWPDNNYTHIAGALAICPTSTELIKELKRAEAATVAMAAALPVSFMKQKASFVALSTMLTGETPHTRGHFEQMRRAIAAAAGTR